MTTQIAITLAVLCAAMAMFAWNRIPAAVVAMGIFGRMERILRLFADVRRGEARVALLLTANVFSLLLAYYLLKVVREPLILAGGGGAEVKTYAAAAQAILLVPAIRAYAVLSRKLGRTQLITAVTAFFAANLVVFFALAHLRVPIGVPFYLWVGVFNVTAVAQFWSFASDVYDEDAGKRLFPIVGVGSALGAVAGARLAKRLLVALGPSALMLVAAVVILLALFFVRAVDRASPRREPTTTPAVRAADGFALILRDRYLLLVAALTLLLNWVNTLGEYILDRTLVARLGSDAIAIGAFKADYFAWVNIVGLLLQLFLVSRVFRAVGVRGALLVMPLVALLGYGTLAFVPLLSLVAVAKVAENSLDYSLQNTARHALFLVTTREEKYQAKAAIDTFVVRVGDVLAAVMVFVGVRLHLATMHFIALNVVLCGLWLGVVLALRGAHRVRAEAVS